MAEDFVTPQIITCPPRQGKGKAGDILNLPTICAANMVVIFDRAVVAGFTPAKLQFLDDSQVLQPFQIAIDRSQADPRQSAAYESVQTRRCGMRIEFLEFFQNHLPLLGFSWKHSREWLIANQLL
jgi:hypothetical protein